MVAIPIFLLVWLGGYVATGSMTVGFHSAAVVFLGWSCLWTGVLFVMALLDKLKFASFLFWGVLGVVAALCLTLGGVQFVIVGIILWVISIIVELLTIPDFEE
jgi:hypothetical protein